MYYVKKIRPTPEVQLAPLIDMVFLLLIFFMVATIFPDDTGIEVQKPQSATATKLPKENLLFLISQNGDIWFSGKKVELIEISKIVQSELEVQPGVMVLVDVDKKAETDSLIKFLDEARKGGAKNLAIGTKEKQKEKTAKNRKFKKGEATKG
ncbi:MAG: biopolymer transporter ExbD [Nitrospinota bacterium]|nr:biopolymer transporter ExbD [Nitrospinota bacterium]